MEQNILDQMNELAALEFFDFGEILDLPPAPIQPVEGLPWPAENQAPAAPFIPNDPNLLLPQVVMPQLGHGQQNVASGQQYFVQQEATGLTTAVPTNLNGAYLPESSALSTRSTSEAIRRIINMNPDRIVTRNAVSPTGQQNQFGRLQIGGTVRYQPPFHGLIRTGMEARAPTPHGAMVVSSATVPAGIASSSQQPPMAPYNAMNHQNGIPRQIVNGVYDMVFKSVGDPLDPHLRQLHRSIMERLSSN